MSPVLVAPLTAPRSGSLLPSAPLVPPVRNPNAVTLPAFPLFLSLSPLSVPLSCSPRVPPVAGRPSCAALSLSFSLSLAVSLTLSALRLFTLLIPQHPPRNNDVRPCFSCFSPSLCFSLARLSSFSVLSSDVALPHGLFIFFSLPLARSLPRYFRLFPLNVPIYRGGGGKDAAGLCICNRTPSRFSLSLS